MWKDVLPIELNLNENEDVILSLANYDVDKNWYEEYKLYLDQQIENKKIYEYNELSESDELDFFNESDFATKNKKYYFNLLIYSISESSSSSEETPMLPIAKFLIKVGPFKSNPAIFKDNELSYPSFVEKAS